MFLRSLSVFEAGSGAFPLPAHIGTIVLISSERHQEGNECQRWVSGCCRNARITSFRETGTKSMGKRGPCLPRKWSSSLGWVQNGCVSKQCVSMREGWRGGTQWHERLTAEGFKGKRRRGVPMHADRIMGVFAGVAERLLMVLLFLASAGICVGPSGDHCPSV